VVLGFDARADICLIALATEHAFPRARIRPSSPPPGTPVWHRGFGIDQPGNKVTGTVIGDPDQDGMIRFRMQASPGDSGASVFDAQMQLVTSPVCCVSADGSLFGGGPIAISQLLKSHTQEPALHYRSWSGWKEVPPLLYWPN